MEGFFAEEINRWVDPDADSEYETYPVERTGETRFRLVESTPFYESYEHDHADQLYETPDAAPETATAPGVMAPPDTTLEADNDPGFY